MADTRQSAFMPMIKCSVCGRDVEISMMGEHVCSTATQEAPPQPPLPDLLGGAFSWFSAKKTAPVVDTAAANGSLQQGGDLTPVSTSTGSLAISPKTPSTSAGQDYQRDNYFAPAIVDAPPPSAARRPGGYGGFGDPEPTNNDRKMSSSPTKGGLNLLDRMNTIARGPFETRAPATTQAPAVRSVSPFESGMNMYPTANTESSSAGSNPGVPPKIPRQGGYGGVGPPSRGDEDAFQQGTVPRRADTASRQRTAEPMHPGMVKRADTFPSRLTAGEPAPARTPSAPGPRPGGRGRQPSEDSYSGRSGLRDTSRPPPPRPSYNRPSTRDGANPPAINLAEEFGVGNPYHSPSISMSSSHSGSSDSHGSRASSNTSPARSANSPRMGPRRQASDTSQIDSLMSDLEISMHTQTRPEDRPAPKVAPSPMDNAQRRSPPSNVHLEPNPQRGTGISPPLRSPKRIPLSPLDPAVQDPISRNRQPSVGEKSRGKCKACSLPITGKSISSADGRLTGRYHKACFVCTTCMEPFSSATFYVLNDKPYCEHHYHKLNGSLCGSCNRGIEGQYLENEDRKKYHPSCFRCGDCGMVLRDGYFEVDGRSYCERDATRRVQPPEPQYMTIESPTRGASLHAPARSSSRAAPAMRSMGLPSSPAAGIGGGLNRPFGVPSGQRLAPGQALGRGGLASMPKLQKRMTRFGMI